MTNTNTTAALLISQYAGRGNALRAIEARMARAKTHAARILLGLLYAQV